MWQQSAIYENSWPPFCLIRIIFTHFKLWIASARHNLTSWVPLLRLKSSYFCRSPVPQWRLTSSFVKYLPIPPLARVSPLIILCLPQGRWWGIPGDSLSSVTWSLHWSYDHTAITWHTFSPWYAYLYKFKMASVGHLGFLTFDRISLESYAIPHFWLIWIHGFYWYGYFYDSRSYRGQN